MENGRGRWNFAPGETALNRDKRQPTGQLKEEAASADTWASALARSIEQGCSTSCT